MDTDPNMYVISLDAIDLNYISASLDHGFGKVKPIWTKSNLDKRNDEYFEFKIEHSDSEDELNTEMGNTLCHICDIDVPTPFMNEHYESFKHKVNVKIINTALDRIKRCVDNSSTDAKKSSNLHFCPVCVTVVNNEEKESHQKSMSHKNSVIVEKFLYDFYLLYANENKESNLNGVDIFEEDREKKYKKRVEPKTNELEENVEQKLTNHNYLYANKINGNIVKSVDEVPKVKKNKEPKIKNSKSDIKEEKNESDLTIKENENSIKVNPKPTRRQRQRQKDKLNNVDVHGHEAAMTFGDFEGVLPDEDKASDVNSKNDVSEYYGYFGNIHHIQETVYYLNCKICNLNINDTKQTKSHLESVSHHHNYLKFLEENMLMETSDTGAVECMACAEVLDRSDEVEHCIKIKHITNLEISNKLKGCC